MTQIANRKTLRSPVSRYTDAEIATLEAARDLLRQHLIAQPIIASWTMLTDYLALMAVDERVEVFRVLYRDTKNRLISDETLGRGTIDHAPVYIREVMRRALELDASAMILCHNHPSGDPTPSRADIDQTKKIKAACKLLGLTLHDHVIVGFGRETDASSMKCLGHI